MAIAPTAAFEELVLEVEFTAGSGTYTRVCGLNDITVNRTNTTDTSEVPDCDDESLPFYIQRGVRTQDVTISGTGTWSLTNHQQMMDWFTSSATKNVRLTNAKVTDDGSSGDTEYEIFPMLLLTLNNERTKGQVVSAEISLERNGSTTFGLIA